VKVGLTVGDKVVGGVEGFALALGCIEIDGLELG